MVILITFLSLLHQQPYLARLVAMAASQLCKTVDFCSPPGASIESSRTIKASQQGMKLPDQHQVHLEVYGNPLTNNLHLEVGFVCLLVVVYLSDSLCCLGTVPIIG